MTQFTISNGSLSVTMPKVKAVEVGGEEVAQEKKMASGKVVKDVLGHRVTISATWDAVPANDLKTLLTMLKGGGFFEVSGPGPDGDISGRFSIGYPSPGIFAFIKGEPMWHNVALRMQAQEVR